MRQGFSSGQVSFFSWLMHLEVSIINMLSMGRGDREKSIHILTQFATKRRTFKLLGREKMQVMKQRVFVYAKWRWKIFSFS